jgi:hypothetical protein
MLSAYCGYMVALCRVSPVPVTLNDWKDGTRRGFAKNNRDYCKIVGAKSNIIATCAEQQVARKCYNFS